MKKVASYALGCKVNQYESEAIAELFEEQGYEVVGIEDVADVYVINTCTVTNFGDRKSRQLIRRVKRQNEAAIVVVSGCYAQTAPEEVMQVEGVNLVIGTKERASIVAQVEAYQEESGTKNLVTDIMQTHEFEPLSAKKLAERTRAYLKIQDGCNQYCSYCIIPFARGPIRSRAPQEVLEEVQKLVSNGFREIVLTGIHIASYGKDRNDTDLLSILEAVHAVAGVERIRFSSISPLVVTEAFIQTMKRLPKVCHHLHLSMQSGCDKTLKEMNRKYTTAHYLQAVKQLREAFPDMGITTDVIVGFPGESDADFAQTKAFVKEVSFADLHVFSYSAKKGTPAAVRKDQIASAVKSERSKALIEIGKQARQDFFAQHVDKTVTVLFERDCGNGIWEGNTGNYMKVQVAYDGDLENKLAEVLVQSVSADTVIGEICNETVR